LCTVEIAFPVRLRSGKDSYVGCACTLLGPWGSGNREPGPIGA